jgi:hypothetical protein
VVTRTLQLEVKVEVRGQRHDVPKLLVEWSSPWEEFVTSIRPALRRSPSRLAGEAPYGIFPYRGMFPSLLLEAFLIFAAIVIRVKIQELRPYAVPRFSSHDVIYYSGDELPRTEDLGGSQAGASGRAGGNEAHHRTQTIKVARGSLTPQVVDAPNLKLPSSKDAVANLLAINPNFGPPPAEGLRSARTPITFTPSVVAPAPNVIHDYTRNGVQMDAVIAPTPAVPRDPFRAAPNLSAEVVPPAPSVTDDHRLVAPALGSPVIPPAPKVSSGQGRNAPNLQVSVVAPAPSVSRDQMRNAPNLQASVVAPAPNISSGAARSAPGLNASVIPPAPNIASRDTSRSPVKAANEAVVPPPASAPERVNSRTAKLNLPAPVIAPPPSANLPDNTRPVAGAAMNDPSKAVVPPPPSEPASGSFVSSLIGKIFGSSEVVPPPPSVSSAASKSAPALAAQVVPPPPSVNTPGGNTKGSRRGMGTSLDGNVIAPPPIGGITGGTGTLAASASKAPVLGMPSVVPPPPSLAGAGGGTGTTAGGKGATGGTLLANNVVPPPPSVSAGSISAGSGSGRNGPGLGHAMDAGAALAPPTGGGSGANAGVVVSPQPGSKVGLPASGGKGSTALSPSGKDKPGLGGAGGAASIGTGSGSGSGLKGEGSGAGKAGAGHGSDPAAHGGISPSAGPGGAGNSPSGNPAVPGVSISGGSTIVTLPSFGSDSPAPDSPAGRQVRQRQQELNVTVVATASSGGAFEPYKNLLRGETYTTYLDTSAGTVVMEFADASGSRPGVASVTAPQAIRTTLPVGLPHARMVISCALDASGNLRLLRVLEPGPVTMTSKVTSALNSWKFQPAMRGNQPIAVSAILGFGIDTNDRF